MSNKLHRSLSTNSTWLPEKNITGAGHGSSLKYFLRNGKRETSASSAVSPIQLPPLMATNDGFSSLSRQNTVHFPSSSGNRRGECASSGKENEKRKGKRKPRRTYRCRLCDMDFARNNDRDRHEKAVHELAQPYECRACKRKFSRNFSLTRHLNVCPMRHRNNTFG